MEIKLNFPKDNNYISNLAFVKALMIKNTIDNLDIDYERKKAIRNKVLETLKTS